MIKNAYESGTEKLVKQATDFCLEPIGLFSFPEMVIRLRDSFKESLTYRKVWGEPRSVWDERSQGFCCVASYYIYQHTGGENIWKFVKSPIHWWLQSKDNNNIFDITYTQFSDYNLKYIYPMGTEELRIKPGVDSEFLKQLQARSVILGKCAGLE